MNIKARLEQGLQLVNSLVSAQVEVLETVVAELAALLRDGAFGKAVTLIGEASFETYLVSSQAGYVATMELIRIQRLSECCSDRLETYRKWVGVATLRSFDMAGVPEDLTIEPLNCELYCGSSPPTFARSLISAVALVIRVLYRLRTLSEQTPFDAATYGYASPLLSQVLVKGGIAIGEEDDPLEQIALSLDIIKFHCGECELSLLAGLHLC